MNRIPLSIRKGELIFLLSILSHLLSAQIISYNIKLWGDSIGRMDVVHTHNKDSSDTYIIESKSKAKFLWIVRDGYSKFEAIYKNGKLISSSHVEIENKKAKRSTTVKYDGKLYQVNSTETGTRSFSETPLCSDASMYFSEYKNTSRIFYLPDASFYNTTRINSNTIEFKSSDGHRNVYLFENGRIKSMEFHLPLASVYMNRIN